MDVKLDFVPPALINFVSRQILGSGFMLYKKVSNAFLEIFFSITIKSLLVFLLVIKAFQFFHEYSSSSGLNRVCYFDQKVHLVPLSNSYLCYY